MAPKRLPGNDPAGASDRTLLRLVAELYYLGDRSQPEIAELTGFSVSKVSRMLALARERGIVRISVERPDDEPSPLAQRLQQDLGVEFVITAGRDTAPPIAARLCGIAAASYVARELHERSIVGLAGGYTVNALVSAMPMMDRQDMVVVPLIGGWDPSNPHLDNNETVRRLARRLGASARVLHTPGWLDSEETKLALMRESSILETTSFWDRLDLALFGMSGTPSLDPGYPSIMDRLGPADRARLVAKGAVGDVAGHLVRVDGRIVEDEWTRRTISIPVETLKKVPRVIAVAAGSNKVEAIVGAARSELVQVIVTDQPTAEGALRLLAPGAQTATR